MDRLLLAASQEVFFGESLENKLRILILEDDPSDAELAESTLRRGSIEFTARRVDTKEAFLRALDEFSPDVILADYSVPSFGGMAALDICQRRCPQVPVIVVSGTIGEEFAIETLKQGATDYVLKHRLSRLTPVVRRALREAEGRVKRSLMEEALRENERKFRELFNNLYDAVFLYQLTKDFKPGRILEVNDTTCRLLGYERYELLEMSRGSIETKEGMDELTKILRNRGESGSFTFETTLISKLGAKIPFEINTRIFNMKGESVVLSIARDITDRRQAQAAQEKLIQELQGALAQVKSLKGLLPICSWCKRIRDDKGYWLEVEAYLHDHTDADFSHGICPECTAKYKKMVIDRRTGRAVQSGSSGGE
ncbi:MAG: PAS domain S-box protein [Ignavibacteria bacterium]|nr:MAG: PAS domain S-box protein [Ignavibacteria bacterium]